MRVLLATAAMIATTAMIAPAAKPAASPPSGLYVVVAARRDPAVTNPQALYQPDDPQLVNRIVSLRPTAVSYDGGVFACPRATARTAAVPAGRLFREIVPERRKPGYRRYALPADFGLAMAPGAAVPVTRYRCAPSTDRRSALEWNDAAVFPIGRGEWGLSFIDDFILIMKPLTGRVGPSFDCGKTGLSPTERTICATPVLAGWDLSVAQAFDQGMRGDPDEQRAWLAERDKCGTDQKCLVNAMSTRTYDLLR